MFLLQPLKFNESLTEGELLLPRYIRTISLHLISWIALALHQLMDQSPPGMMQTLTMTFLQAEIGLSCSKFSFCATTVLFHWGWFCEVLLHYIRTISLSLPLISWIALALPPLMASPLPGFCVDSFTCLLLEISLAYSRFRLYTTSVLLHWGWSCELLLHYIRTFALTARQFKIISGRSIRMNFEDKSGNYKPHPICLWRPVTWPEAKPKTSRYNYGKRLSRQTSRFFSNYGKRLGQ